MSADESVASRRAASRFVVYPAIDLRGGRAVRLRQGDPARETMVGADPVGVARRWAAEGAAWLHVVDLDGALHGTPRHLSLVGRICRGVGVPVQVGGGLRTMTDLRGAFDAGAGRAILGTGALAPDLLAEAVAAFGDRIAVALDARDGRVAVAGWQQLSALPILDAVRRLADAGVARVIYTDIARDGMLTGLNVEGLRQVVAATDMPVIASGGIAAVDDLRAAQAAGAEGAIIGRALYDGRVTLAGALSAVEEVR
jgi:phosphoribosylformimino-5-aminoimidazole carboxamide ribotide isomerase